MNNFIPPTKGTKIAELNLSILQYLIYKLGYYLGSRIYFVLFLMLIRSYLVADTRDDWFWLRDPDNAFSWIVPILVGLAFLEHILNYKNKPKNLSSVGGRTFSLFLAEDGVEIDDIFIPFKNEYTSPKKGIVSFKLDGEFLILKTEGKEYIALGWGGITEKKIKFKIEPKYYSNKEELLLYLNSEV